MRPRPSPQAGSSRAPIYRAIQADLQRDILSGSLEPGDWLPSESQLRRTYGVSQTSVRRALLELERLGLIERFQGRGSAVASNEIRAISPMLGLGRELRQRGFQIHPDLIRSVEEPATEIVAARLGIETAEPLRHIERRYLLDDEPFVYLDHYLPLDPRLDYDEFTGDSLYAFLTVRDAQPARAQERVTALNLSSTEAELLGVPTGQAALLRERTSFRSDGKPMEFTRYVLRSDRYHLDIDLKQQF